VFDDNDDDVQCQEMECLEKHLEELSSECKDTVEKYVKDVEANPELDKIFSDSCREFWTKHCKVGCSLLIVKNSGGDRSNLFGALKLLIGWQEEHLRC